MDTFDWNIAVEQALRDYRNLEALKVAQLGDMLIARRLIPSTGTAKLQEHQVAISVQHLIDLGLAELGGFEPELATLLDLRFRQRKPVIALESELHSSKTVIYERLKQAISALVSVLIRLEANAVNEMQSKNNILLRSLPRPTYQQWIGDAQYIAQVHRVLDEGSEMDRKMPIFITGIGGLGKTSLAREAIATWLEGTNQVFDRLLWTIVVQPLLSLSVQLEQPRRRYTLDQVLADLGEQLEVSVASLPSNTRKLRVIDQALQGTSALIVVDNVESPDDVSMVLRLVDAFAPVAQILVTSRYHIQHDIGYNVPLSELSERNACILLELEAERLHLSNLDQSVFNRLYATLGGHPHALKLVIAQLAQLPVEQALRGLENNSLTAQALFRYIYEKAWSFLSPEAQDLMLGLWLLPAAGASWEELKVALNASGGFYADDDMERFIRELTALNLIQTSQAQPLIYSLHRLTYNFLGYKLGLGENMRTI